MNTKVRTADGDIVSELEARERLHTSLEAEGLNPSEHEDLIDSVIAVMRVK